jgi:hypothetical protein
MAKPSKLPAWDTTEVNSVEPDTTHQDEGWLAPGGVPEKPPFQTFNHWMNAVWKWIKEFNKQGIVEWDGVTTYDINNTTKGSNGIIYRSLQNANTNNDPVSSPTWWRDELALKAPLASPVFTGTPKKDTFDMYHRDNILGIVSQTLGVPTGAIIEEGENANGRWIRFADGTQINTVVQNITTNGTLPQSNVWTFPKSFQSATPRISHSNKVVTSSDAIASGVQCGIRGLSSSSVTITTDDLAGLLTTQAVDGFFIAIGRWYA